jgi:protein-disulfide isomerase
LIPVGDRDHVLGAEEPALTVIEYGDFGCPFCFAASRPLQSLLDRYDSLRLVWRHFPDPEVHPGADLAAELSELAAVHGKFWEAHSLLLAGRERFSTEDLLSVGGRLDLDPAEVESAIRDRAYRERVLEDAAGGRKAGVHGTPTFFVGGERLVGHWRQLAQVVPAALSERQP